MNRRELEEVLGGIAVEWGVPNVVKLIAAARIFVHLLPDENGEWPVPRIWWCERYGEGFASIPSTCRNASSMVPGHEGCVWRLLIDPKLLTEEGDDG